MSVSVHSCPSCSSVLQFRSRDTNLIVCHQCGARLRRWEDGVLKVYDRLVKTQDTLTPVQVSTTGIWNNKKFIVTGRIRCLLDEGLVNIWNIHFEDGCLHLLVECYGQFSVYEKIAPDAKLTFAKVRTLGFGSGAVETVGKKKYVLERKNSCRGIEVEGEVLVFDWNGAFHSLGIASHDRDRIAMWNLDSDRYLYFRIHSHAFEEFGFQQVRALKTGAVTQTFTCTQCNKPNELRSYPLSQSFCCRHCGAAHSCQGGRLKFRRRLKQDRIPGIPLYSTGTLKGIEYEIVGFAEKEDTESWAWREYTLFNPVHGYSFLSEYNGHWIFLREKVDAPVMMHSNRQGLSFSGEIFLLYNEYRYSIKDGRGEFPADVFDDAQPHCREFISPPELWAREYNKVGFTWYHGEHVGWNELYKAFGTEISLPYRTGVGPVQPVKGYVNPQWLKMSLLWVGLLFLGLTIITTTLNRSEVVYSSTWNLADSVTTQSTVTPRFRLDKGSSNLQLKIEAPVINNWFEANITLVNADNGKEYTLEEGVEYYTGYEDGESWSEGSTTNEALLTSIPGGNYFLEIIASKPVGSSPAYYTLEARYDVPMWSNFFVFLLMALIPGGILYGYIVLRERARWSNSAYSPFNTDSLNDQ